MKFYPLILALSLLFSAAVALSAAPAAPDATPQPAADQSVVPESAASGWQQSASFVTRAGSLSVLSMGFVPQAMSSLISSGIRTADVPGKICGACLWFGDVIHNLGSTIVSTVKETVHWLALPLHIFKAGLERMPLPGVAGGQSGDTEPFGSHTRPSTGVFQLSK